MARKSKKAAKAKPVKKKTKAKPAGKPGKKVSASARKKAAPQKPLKKAPALKVLKKNPFPKPAAPKTLKKAPVKAIVAKKAATPKRPSLPKPAAALPLSPAKKLPLKSTPKLPHLPKEKIYDNKYAEHLPAGSKKPYQIEFEIKASPRMLYNYLSNPSGLSGWFADDVTYLNGIFIFHWNGSEERGRLVVNRENKTLRYQWTDRNDNSYFQFDIVQDDITSDISLLITDFASDDRERAENIMVWENQVHALMQILGSH